MPGKPEKNITAPPKETSAVTSADGTAIAFTRSGDGPPVVLVDGAMCYRASGPAGPLAERLAAHFTVYTYDRRGRGESGDTPPYAVQREVEDLAAVIGAAGGSACVYGISSGAALALEAASNGLGISRLALYEAPFVVEPGGPVRPADYLEKMDAMIAAGRRSQAVQTFMRTVGVPRVFITVMRMSPMWKRLTAVAHTLPYDFRVLGDTGSGQPLPADAWSGVTVPTLVMDGAKSPAYMRNGMASLAKVLPNAEHRSLRGQTHMLQPDAVAPLLVEFFGG